MDMKKVAGILALTFVFLFFSSVNTYAHEFHTVKSGDNLWKIAQNYGTTVANLIRINNLESDFLQIGQKVIIASNTNIPLPEQIAPKTLVEQPPDLGLTYVVKPGDNLWSIARQNNTTVNNLLQANNLSSDALHVGQHLTIPGIEQVENLPKASASRGGSPFSGERIVQYASQYIGTPYRYGGQSPSGFDCSGFTSYIFDKFQIKLNRTAAGQYNHGVAVAKNELEVGDLVFFAGGKNIDHVGIYSGHGQIIHSSSPRSGGVIYSSINDGYYARTYVGAKRVR